VIIRSLRVRTPSLRVTNADVLAAVRDANPGVAPDEVRRYCRALDYLLRRAGARTRFYRDRAKGETALDLITDVSRQAMEDSGAAPSQIDAVIFCGVARGFLEPATAAFVSGALGLTCDAFDVSEACMSWVRALQIADSLLRTGTYSTVLIVNGEFTVFEHGVPDIYVIKSPDQLRHTFAAFTIGEAASAMVVGASPDEWHFRLGPTPGTITVRAVVTGGTPPYRFGVAFGADDPVPQEPVSASGWAVKELTVLPTARPGDVLNVRVVVTDSGARRTDQSSQVQIKP
jgi:hypothetical protein